MLRNHEQHSEVTPSSLLRYPLRTTTALPHTASIIKTGSSPLAAPRPLPFQDCHRYGDFRPRAEHA